jgi:hypothetical protein
MYIFCLISVCFLYDFQMLNVCLTCVKFEFLYNFVFYGLRHKFLAWFTSGIFMVLFGLFCVCKVLVTGIVRFPVFSFPLGTFSRIAFHRGPFPRGPFPRIHIFPKTHFPISPYHISSSHISPYRNI